MVISVKRKGESRMKKTLVFLLMVAFIVLSATIVWAGGDQVRGDKAQGQANQVQVQDPPPFQP